VVRILFTSAKRSEVEEGLEKLFDETVFSANKKNTKNLEKTIKRLEKKGYNRWEICYIGDDFCKDFLPAMRCGLNTLLLRWIL